MATKKQIAANRSNAKSSESARHYSRNIETPGSTSGQGPKTPEGKAVSSQNACRYDLLAKSFVLRSECPARFQTFIDSFYAEFNPATLAYRRATDSGRSIELTNRAESRLQQQLNSAYDRLRRVQLAPKVGSR